MAPLHGLAQVLRDRGGIDVVQWESRPLRSFAEDPLDRFQADFDLIVYDYPFAGEALEAGWVHDLSDLLPADVLADRRRGCVGRTYESFSRDGGQAALPLDAATHVAAAAPTCSRTAARPSRPPGPGRSRSPRMAGGSPCR